MDGEFQSQIPNLPGLKSYRYENIFKLYKTNTDQYYYNLLQSVFMPDKISEETVYYQLITTKMPWTIISFNAYKTIDLWWLICLTNKIYNPVKLPEENALIKIIKPQFVSTVVNEINNSIKQ
jgi:hypothetical protein